MQFLFLTQKQNIGDSEHKLAVIWYQGDLTPSFDLNLKLC